MPNKVTLSSPPSFDIEEEQSSWKTWFNSIHTRVGEGPFLIQGFNKADPRFPSASSFGTDDTPVDIFSSIIYVPDASGGASLAFSDGSEWISLLTGSAI